MKRKILLIGGTGIVGKAIISEALKNNDDITVIGLDINKTISQKIRQININRKNNEEFRDLCKNELNSKWDIVIDISKDGTITSIEVLNASRLFSGDNKKVIEMASQIVDEN